MPTKYEMRISRRTVDKLGVKLYDKVAAVIAELVSNSYDADATKVSVEAPMGQYLATQTGGTIQQKGCEIRVTDNGAGMTPDELQAYYLVVGSERRDDPKRGDKSPKFKRPVTGRKGVGKLAPFGICKQIEVISAGGGVVDGKDATGAKARGYLTSHIILNYDDIVDDDNIKPYLPQVGRRDQTVSAHPGTTTILKDFVYRKVPEMDLLARQMAQRFGFPSEKWSVKLQDNTKSKGSPEYERKVGVFDIDLMRDTKIEFKGAKSTFIHPTKPSGLQTLGPSKKIIPEIMPGIEHNGKFYPVTGWVAYSKKPYSDDLMAGVRIYCRGKIAAQTSLFGRRAGFTGEHTVRSYLVGELNADWLDEDEDRIQTDRRDILWSDSVGEKFQEWGQTVVKRIGTLSRTPMRQSVKDRFFKIGNVLDKIKKEFPRDDQTELRKRAEQLATMFSQTISPDEVGDEEIVDGMMDLVLLLAPHMALDELLREAADEKQTPIKLVSNILRTARLAELASFGRIAADRVGVIKRLEDLKDDKNTEEDQLQELIAGAPWLINSQWAPISENKSFNVMRRELEKYIESRTGKSVYLGEFNKGTKRPDFVLSSEDSKLQLIEIKRPQHKLTNSEVDRIVNYDQILADFLKDPNDDNFRTVFTTYKITLVCDGTSLTGTSKRAFEGMVDSKTLEHMNWKSFLIRTRRTHQAFLEEAERQKKQVNKGAT